MAEDPFLVFMEEVTEICDKMKEVYAKIKEANARIEEEKASLNSTTIRDILGDDSRVVSTCMSFIRLWLRHSLQFLSQQRLELELELERLTSLLAESHNQLLTSLTSEEGEPLRIGGRRLADAIVVSAVVLLSFVYLYLVGYIDRGGSKAGSSGSLDFRDIYISIVLFQAAYVWIKFRDVIPRGAVYRRPNSDKYETRIKLPVTKGSGGKSKRIPLGLFDTFAEGLVAYQIAAFYCKKPEHKGQLDLGGGAPFPIPALSVDPDLPYEEKRKQVRDQVLKLCAEFEERKASRSLPPSVPGLAFAMPTGEGQLLATSPIQQLGQPLNSGMDSSMQCQGSQLDPNTHNGVDFSNPDCLLALLAKTQHELLDAHKQNECLKAQVSRTEFENMGWEVKYSELEQRNLQLELENGLLKHQIQQLQSQLQTQHQEQEFDTDGLFSVGHEESLAR